MVLRKKSETGNSYTFSTLSGQFPFSLDPTSALHCPGNRERREGGWADREKENESERGGQREREREREWERERDFAMWTKRELWYFLRCC